MATLHEKFKDVKRNEGVYQTFLTELIVGKGGMTTIHSRDRPVNEIQYIPFNEMSYSIPLEKRDRQGRPKVVTRYIDVFFFVALGTAAAYHRDVLTVGIEIKGNARNLWDDHKMQNYIGKANYFFLAVRDNLIPEALRKIDGMDGIGLFSLSTGKIIKPAKWYKVDRAIKEQLLFKALLHNTISFRPPFATPEEKKNPSGENKMINCLKDKTKSKTNRINCLTSKKIITMEFLGKRKNEERAVRVELKNGNFEVWKGAGKPTETFNYAVGTLDGIELRRRKTACGEIVFCDFHMKHDDHRFDISTIASSAVTADIVSRLLNVEDPVNSQLRIDVWAKGPYTNVRVKEEDRVVKFASLPEIKRIDKGVKVEIDTTERDMAVMGMIDQINARLHNAS